jgi:Fe-S cluster assembly ATP-binding protein
MGVFFIPQHSINLDGVNTLSFLRVLNEQRQKPLTFEKLYDLIAKNMQILKLPTELLKRDLNVEFSGGQKKKMELLQSLIVEPKIYLIDEIDSGLDIEAIKVISNFIKQKKKDSIFFIISHNNEFIKSIKPNKIAVMHNKKIIKIASPSIVNQIERSGYQTFCPNNEDIKKRLLNKCLMKK